MKENPVKNFFFLEIPFENTQSISQDLVGPLIFRGVFLFLTPSVKLLNGCCDTAHIIPSLLIYGCTFASQPWICLSAGHKCAFWGADQLCFCCSNGIFSKKINVLFVFSTKVSWYPAHLGIQKAFKQNKKYYVDDQSPYSSGFFPKISPFKYNTKLAGFIFLFSFIPTTHNICSSFHIWLFCNTFLIIFQINTK